MKLLGKQSFSKGIVSSTVLNVFAKGFQFINTILIAYFFGANSTTDLYYFILSLSILISTLINNLDNVVFIPEFIKIKETQSEKSGFDFLNLYIFIYTIIGLVIGLVILFSKASLFALIFNVGNNEIVKNIYFIKTACLLPLLMLITNLFSSIANAYSYFSIPVIISLVNGLIVLSITIFFHKTFGALGGIIALVIGYSINISILVFILIKKIKWDFTSVFWGIKSHIKSTIFISYFTSFPLMLRNYMVTYLFNGIGGGILTAISWGQQIAALPDIFITNQIVNIASIKFSEYSSKAQYPKAYDLLYKIIEYLFIILFVCMFISIIYSNEIVKILLSRGSFSKEKANITSVIFALLSAVPVVSVFSIIIGRLFIAFQMLNKTTVITTFSHIIIMGLLYFAIKNYGYIGFGIASIIGYCIPTILFIYISPKNFEGLNLSIVFKKILIPIIFISILAFILFIIHRQITNDLHKYLSFIAGSSILIFAALLFYKKTIAEIFKTNSSAI